ncbi:MAG TPA: hypothetical protein V6D03_15990, partial [Candidatus Caenarcaniphilales bacterium]
MSTSSFSTASLVSAESGSAYVGAAVPNPGRWVEVLVDCPTVEGLFTYNLPTHLAVQPGDILSVPFGTQQVGAIAVRLVTQLPPAVDLAQVRDVQEIISPGFFPVSYWTLLHRVAQYYHTPLMQAIRVALPPGLLGRAQRRIRLAGRILPEATLELSPPAHQLLTLLQSNSTGDY